MSNQNETQLRKYINKTLNLSFSTELSVEDKLQIMDSAWQAQKRIWQANEILN
ncbi:hypothetical protein Pse7367_2353 [Thalassoporum mexicanum PCC 7367]|uniref:hypothetical protein n=1 Tax=Thalassoporum mexicanum TaxID=3457544 RepID=UPI00029FC0FC|nr:hypothetical protein [Pseudanabaena sp. PCC 7367]AFY70614.1 hypothetical protein Pse7367_2353 [Pseudanabaena sp. PCC 7367]